MAIKHFVCGLLLATAPAAPAGSEVFRWVDEQGQVHFGDCPPPDCRSEQIEIAPGPSERSVRAAQERAEQLRAAERELSQQQALPAADAVTGTAGAPAAGRDREPACFSPLEKAWGGAVPDTREPPLRRALSATEYRQLRDLLDEFARRRRGTVDETICIRPDATQPTKTERYRADVHGFWKSDEVLEVGTKMIGEDSGRVLREFFWILPSRDGLRFRAANTDSLSVLDRPGNDVEVIGLSAGSLKFFRRQGGNLRRVTVYDLRKTASGVGLEEYFYVQGALAEKRIWALGR
jgi:hypothetical protein